MPESQSFKKASKRKQRTKKIVSKMHRACKRAATEFKRKNLWARLMQLIEMTARIKISAASNHLCKLKPLLKR